MLRVWFRVRFGVCLTVRFRFSGLGVILIMYLRMPLGDALGVECLGTRSVYLKMPLGLTWGLTAYRPVMAR